MGNGIEKRVELVGLSILLQGKERPDKPRRRMSILRAIFADAGRISLDAASDGRLARTL